MLLSEHRSSKVFTDRSSEAEQLQGRRPDNLRWMGMRNPSRTQTGTCRRSERLTHGPGALFGRVRLLAAEAGGSRG